jgi:hypothetical protein
MAYMAWLDVNEIYIATKINGLSQGCRSEFDITFEYLI